MDVVLELSAAVDYNIERDVASFLAPTVGV
jgi:hypothetical protein